MAAHLPRLRMLSAGLELAVEFGVKRGGSATALLLGAQRVISIDIKPTREAQQLQQIVGDRWDYRICDSRTAQISECDLLFLDSHHSYAQVSTELEAHGHKVRRYLIFHDSITFGSIAAASENGKQAWTYTPAQSVPQQFLGIRPAIDLYMAQDDSWRVKSHYVDSHGLLVLERRR